MLGVHLSYDYTDHNGVLLRVCAMCGYAKPMMEFAKNGVDADGQPKRRKTCRTCYNAIRRENKTKSRHASFVGGMRRRGEENVDYTLQEWKETVIHFGGTCAYCGRTMRKGERLTRDHLLPVKQGGATTQDNIVPACSSCNSSKGASEWREWYMKQPYFSQGRMNKIFAWRQMLRAAGVGGEQE